jgi:hypothetical protein
MDIFSRWSMRFVLHVWLRGKHDRSWLIATINFYGEVTSIEVIGIFENSTKFVFTYFAVSVGIKSLECCQYLCFSDASILEKSNKTLFELILVNKSVFVIVSFIKCLLRFQTFLTHVFLKFSDSCIHLIFCVLTKKCGTLWTSYFIRLFAKCDLKQWCCNIGIRRAKGGHSLMNYVRM